MAGARTEEKFRKGEVAQADFAVLRDLATQEVFSALGRLCAEPEADPLLQDLWSQLSTLAFEYEQYYKQG